MSTSAISSLSIYQELQTFYQTRQSDLQTLGSALQSGDLTAAQQAYSQLVSLGQSGPFGSTQPFQRSDRASDFAAIGQALSSGNLAGAQAAFAKLQQTFGQAQTTTGPGSLAYTVKLSTASPSGTSSSSTGSSSSGSSGGLSTGSASERPAHRSQRARSRSTSSFRISALRVEPTCNSSGRRSRRAI